MEALRAVASLHMSTARRRPCHQHVAHEHVHLGGQDACEAHGCTLALDAVAGAQAGAILNAMAPGGKLVVYGGLSGRPVDGVAWNELIFQRKSMEGFWMTHRVQTQLATPEGASELRRDLTAVGRLLSTHLRTNVSR
jgi:NADPH:quinone reductase-like Zn-dependent oxidoreductase